MFPGLMEGPVLLKVVAGAQGAELKDRFGPLEAPAGPGDLHAILDKVAAGPFDHPRGEKKRRG
jgi:hypothetical protein